MTTEQFRDALARLALSQGALSRLLAQLGDPASSITIRRRVEGWAQGRSRVPGEMVALLTVLERFPAVLAALVAPPLPEAA